MDREREYMVHLKLKPVITKLYTNIYHFYHDIKPHVKVTPLILVISMAYITNEPSKWPSLALYESPPSPITIWTDGTGVIPDVGSIFLQCVQICVSLGQDTWYNTMDNISLNQCKGHDGPHFSIANPWKMAANNII